MRRGIVLGNKKYSLTKSVPKRHLQLYRILFVVKHSEYSNSCYPFCPVIIRKKNNDEPICLELRNHN